MNSILRIGLALGIFLWPVPPTEAAGPQKFCEPQVSERLDFLAVDPSDIHEITYEANQHPGRDDDRIVRILAWVNLYSCEGYVIVKLSPLCTVREVYTRGECKIRQCDQKSGRGC